MDSVPVGKRKKTEKTNRQKKNSNLTYVPVFTLKSKTAADRPE